MRRIRPPCHTPPPPVIYEYHHNECSRPFSPHVRSPVRPAIPVRGYWIPEAPPPPVKYNVVYVEPPTHEQPWYPSPIIPCEYNQIARSHLQPPLPPSPPPPPPVSSFFDPSDYNQNDSPYPHYPRSNRGIIVEKLPFPVTPIPDFFTHKLNPFGSPVKNRLSPKTSSEKSFVTPKHKDHNKKFKTRKNLVDQIDAEIKEENGKYRYNKLNNELHPEILATWRKNLNISKESSSTHKVKIEICLKKEKKTLSVDGGNSVQKQSDLKMSQPLSEYDKGKFYRQSKQLNKKMSSSNSVGSEKSPVEDGLNLPVSSIRDKKHISFDNKSALRFTPSQINKVHKRKNDDSHNSLLKRKSCYPQIVDTLKRCSREEHEKLQSRNSGKASDKDRGSESPRISSFSHVTPESYKSCNSEQDLDSGVDTYRSGEEYSQSPASSSRTSRSPVTNRKLSLSAFKSNSSLRRSEHHSNNDIDETLNSSIYVTPERTPLSMESKEAEEFQREHSRFKRSLTDDCNDESHSANSSLNNSGYYTAESSPRKYSYAKRPKTRWSDTSTLIQNNPSYSSWRHNASFSSEQGIQPELIGYQMVGDSQFCRFGQQLLGLERVHMPNCPGRVGICVSGQTITDLHRRVKENFYPISDKIIIMIGTNDFLRNVDVSTMCEELSALIKTLQKSASNIVLLTLPPIPKLEKKSSTEHFRLLDAYNSHIRSLENGGTLRIADISPLYMTSPPYRRCRMHLFEMYFNGPAKRFDLIHLNRLGLEVIRKYILDKFL